MPIDEMYEYVEEAVVTDVCRILGITVIDQGTDLDDAVTCCVDTICGLVEQYMLDTIRRGVRGEKWSEYDKGGESE